MKQYQEMTREEPPGGARSSGPVLLSASGQGASS